MSLEALLNRSETKTALTDHVRHAVQHEYQTSREVLNASVANAIEEALQQIVPQIRSWAVNAETFSDAVEKLQQAAVKQARHLLATSTDQQAFRSMRPEIPALDQSQADIILNGREPSMLRDIYLQGLSKKNEDLALPNMGREVPEDRTQILEERYQSMRKWAAQR